MPRLGDAMTTLYCLYHQQGRIFKLGFIFCFQWYEVCVSSIHCCISFYYDGAHCYSTTSSIKRLTGQSYMYSKMVFKYHKDTNEQRLMYEHQQGPFLDVSVMSLCSL